MPRTENQKLKALYVAKYIRENSDENHDFTATDIRDYLRDDCGIIAERRSIYRDLDALSEVFDFDIERRKGGKFRLRSRQFDIDDLRLLAECVDAANFISASTAKELVGMLTELCSIYEAEQLESEVFVCNRAKTTQKGVLQNISRIRGAMSRRRDCLPHIPSKITFKYLKYTINDLNTQVERRKGENYKVSPYKLLINNGNYYLLAYCDNKKDLRTYRVDRMKDVKEINEPREGEKEFAKVDLESYTQRVISMYSGKDERVSIRFIPPLLDTMIERFGTGSGVIYSKEDDKHYLVSTHVEISDQFFGWLCGFGIRAKLIYPESAVEQFKKYLDKIGSIY